MSKFLLLVFIVCAFSFAVSAQDKFLAKVQIYVQYNGESATNSSKELMSSYISRELRSLGDVEIVSVNPDYRIDVVFVDVLVGGRNVGYAVSISFLKSAKCTFKETNYDGTPVSEDCDASLYGTTAAISLDSLKETAEILVAKFDAKILENQRAFFKRNKNLRDSLEKTKIKP